MIGGALGGLVHAIATVSFGVDHIISGVAINVTAPGLARFLSSEILTNHEGGSITQSPRTAGVGRFTFPFLAGGDLFGWGHARHPRMVHQQGLVLRVGTSPGWPEGWWLISRWPP